MGRYFLFAAVALWMLLSSTPVLAESPTKPGRYTETIVTRDGTRESIVRIPTHYKAKKRVPLVIVLHGRGSSGIRAEQDYNWVELANRENFIVCFPTAQRDSTGKAGWNAGDVAILSDLIHKLKSTYSIDPKRVYMTGHSSGAIMSYRFGAAKSEVVAAIAPVAGGIPQDSTRAKSPFPPLSLIVFHGKKDKVVPYYSRAGFGNGRSRLLSAPDSVRWFARADGCVDTPKREESFVGNIIKETFWGGKNGTAVVLYTIVDGQHSYPTGKYHRKESKGSNQQIDATELIWAFFKAHPKQ